MPTTVLTKYLLDIILDPSTPAHVQDPVSLEKKLELLFFQVLLVSEVIGWHFSSELSSDNETGLRTWVNLLSCIGCVWQVLSKCAQPLGKQTYLQEQTLSLPTPGACVNKQSQCQRVTVITYHCIEFSHVSYYSGRKILQFLYVGWRLWQPGADLLQAKTCNKITTVINTRSIM